MLSVLYPSSVLRALLLFLLMVTEWSFADVPNDLLKEAKKIYQVQENYLNKCLESDWESIYNYQHPYFRNKVSINEFMYFDGKVTFDYRDGLRGRLSGGVGIPALKYIQENPVKKDILGFPSKRKYQITTNPLVKVNKFSIESIAITPDKKYTKITTRLIGQMLIEPGITRGIIKTRFNQLSEYYWEKVDGNWVITILKDVRNLSGNSFFYFIPNDPGAWKEKKFIQISASELIRE